MQTPRSSARAASVLAVALALLATLLTACGSTSPRDLLSSIRHGNVILGTKYDQPGLGMRNPDKSMTGFDVDVLRYVVDRIADKNGWKHPKIKWRETPSAQRETLIGNGEVDIIAATYSINAARSKKVDFAGPYLVIRQGLLVRADDHDLQSLTDLNKGKKLCSVTGSTSAQNVKAQLPGVQLQEFDTYSTCVEALHRSKVDALTTDETILAGFAQMYPGEFQVVDMTYPKDACVKGVLKKAGSPFSTERYGIGLSKGDKPSRDALDSALNDMISSGAWEQALRKALGTTEVDRLIARAGGFEQFKPPVGDLSFLDSASTPCEGV
ncbi:glutamate ABC transporter substrate-binding protein [Tsukamurella sp. 8F]|uniref:glutamate ABC transporter substrate-binding protein n=1 Tax=unclassified Tsukamurella TaxID=2633480 RepID=UPI0023B9A8E4|nr:MULTISPECIES: glutamate ABC transporter substrate-binding protein [unclassified Tsukamurella]MDF0531472.1 glutamate ABC transporter substrate-binding protein [Tsukamurella sp. 8J]MDF0587465.1 glutamate ABC transporter substrate-binding protein [Tsukamurella sp. 8F]